MSTARNRSRVPSIVAVHKSWPLSTRARIALTTSTPFNTACPSSAMKPTAADTLSVMPTTDRPRKPPNSATGMLTRMIDASHTVPNALNSSRNVSRIDSGSTGVRRFIARCWVAPSPAHTRA